MPKYQEQFIEHMQEILKHRHIIKFNKETCTFFFQKENKKTHEKVGAELILKFKRSDNGHFIPRILVKDFMRSPLLIAGHIYEGGELCHNFVVQYIDPKNKDEIKDNAHKLAYSLIKYIDSLILENGCLISNIPENDLVEYEQIILRKYPTILYNLTIDLSVGDKLGIINHIKVLPIQHIGPLYKNLLVHVPRKSIISSPVKFNNYYFLSITNDVVIKEIKNDHLIVEKSNGDEYKVNIIKETTQNKEVIKYDQIALIGLGSVGSFVGTQLLHWPKYSTLWAIDPDLYMPKNSIRSSFNNSRYFSRKIDIFNDFSLYRIPEFFNWRPKVKTIFGAISLRLSGNLKIVIQKAIEKSQFIIDCTGSNESGEIMCKTNPDSRFFKVGLYNSGNIAIFASFKGSEYKEVSKKWTNIVTSNDMKRDSAYNSDNPADYNITSIMAGVFFSFIKSELNSKNNKMKVIKYEHTF